MGALTRWAIAHGPRVSRPDPARTALRPAYPHFVGPRLDIARRTAYPPSIAARPGPSMKSSFFFYVRLVFAWMFVLVFALKFWSALMTAARAASSSCGCS